jgi:hypothetical protein
MLFENLALHHKAQGFSPVGAIAQNIPNRTR